MKISAREVCLAYAHLPFVTPARIRLMLEHFHNLQTVPQAPARLLQGLLAIDADQAAALRDPKVIDGPGVVTLADDDYPPMLKEIIDPPLALFHRGDISMLRQPLVAVVGSRRASPYGINASRALARDLASASVGVVSGLARGIDAAAHEATLSAGGRTVAVLGTGIDVVYPRSHRKLTDAIAERGLVVSEFAPGTPPLAQNFPIRNRVISGLSSGVVIVEATSRSGSLITARTAAEQGREVFAVPGSIFSRGTEGTHRLIQYGAKLVHDVNDILEELPGNLIANRHAVPALESPLREVLEVFTHEDATHIDAAASKLGRSVAQVSEAVLQLELDGFLRALPGSRYVRER